MTNGCYVLNCRRVSFHGSEAIRTLRHHPELLESAARERGVGPGAGDDPSRGAAYNEKAAGHSWQAMKSFFAEMFEHE